MTKQYFNENTTVGIVNVDKQDFIEKMLQWCNNSEATFYMVTGLYPLTAEKLEREYKSLTNRNNVIFSIIDKGTEEVIGFAGLYMIHWQSRHAEYRILIGDKARHNQGIGQTVTDWIIRFAFEKMNLNKVWLGVNEENKGAVRCYEKSGFIREGVLRQELFRNNEYYNIIRMSILREERYKIDNYGAR